MNIVDNIVLLKATNIDIFIHIPDNFIFALISLVHETFENIKSGEALLKDFIFGIQFLKISVLFIISEELIGAG